MARRSSLMPVFGALLLAGWFVIGTAGFALIEGWEVVDALYMTVITISTVGFKEVHPLSDAGKMFSVIIIVGGLGSAGYTLTRGAQFLVEGELLDILGRRRMRSNLEKLRGHHIVCGYGRIGKPVALGLESDQQAFCVIDRDPSIEEVAIKKPTGEMIFNPDASETISIGDTLVAMGRERELDRLESLCAETN